MVAKFKRVPVETVPVGSVLKAAIADPNNPQIKLLTEGTPVTREFIDKLRARGITEVVISLRDLALIRAFEPQGRAKRVPPEHHYVQSLRVNDFTKEIDRRLHEGAPVEVGEITEPLVASITRPTDCSYADGLTQQWAHETDHQIESLGEFFDQTCANADASAGPLREKCESILSRVKEDLDALVCQAGTPFPSDYPSRHAVHVATMAIAIGVELGLDHENLMDLGMGCLIHDVGMQKIGLELFDSKSKISQPGLRRLADHPVHAMEVAGGIGDELSDKARMVAYQIHERLDGSGYPRGRTFKQIHQLARIAGVADAFIALITPRPHRPGIQGHYAVKYLLEQVAAGKLDPKAVRGLLQTTSLYPIGSYVVLNNDAIGRVIRTGGREYDRPTIEMWSNPRMEGPSSVVNLKSDRTLKIRASLPAPKAA